MYKEVYISNVYENIYIFFWALNLNSLYAQHSAHSAN
jgi:hypothetical protein